jgi:hypothetical protein
MLAQYIAVVYLIFLFSFLNTSEIRIHRVSMVSQTQICHCLDVSVLHSSRAATFWNIDSISVTCGEISG